MSRACVDMFRLVEYLQSSVAILLSSGSCVNVFLVYAQATSKALSAAKDGTVGRGAGPVESREDVERARERLEREREKAEKRMAEELERIRAREAEVRETESGLREREGKASKREAALWERELRLKTAVESAEQYRSGFRP